MRLEQTLEEIRENRIELLSKLAQAHFMQNEYRTYLKPVNEKFPAGYAMTFKIVKVKRRKRK